MLIQDLCQAICSIAHIGLEIESKFVGGHGSCSLTGESPVKSLGAVSRRSQARSATRSILNLSPRYRTDGQVVVPNGSRIGLARIPHRTIERLAPFEPFL
jgi:hypothetical protein